MDLGVIAPVDPPKTFIEFIGAALFSINSGLLL